MDTLDIFKESKDQNFGFVVTSSPFFPWWTAPVFRRCCKARIRAWAAPSTAPSVSRAPKATNGSALEERLGMSWSNENSGNVANKNGDLLELNDIYPSQVTLGIYIIVIQPWFNQQEWRTVGFSLNGERISGVEFWPFPGGVASTAMWVASKRSGRSSVVWRNSRVEVPRGDPKMVWITMVSILKSWLGWFWGVPSGNLNIAIENGHL